MSFSGNSRHFPAESSSSGDRNNHLITSPNDPLTALTNLVTLRTRMDSLQRFLSDSLARRTLLPTHHMNRVTSELTSAIHQVIVNGATLLSFSQPDPSPIDPNPEVLDDSDKEDERIEVQFGEDFEIVEIDAVELLAEHIHFCEICGKGFKRDANLRMHMRAHGNQFKSPRALARPDRPAAGDRRTRFSCPYNGCNRNQKHKSFRPLKSVICVKNHFKRSHCPKTYSCDRCHKKSFSVMADLKSHLKSCGNSSKWKCSCGSTFSRKDKLFGHMALFEGHMPAVNAIADEEEAIPTPNVIEEEQTPVRSAGDELLFDGLLEDFGSIDNQCLQELMMTVNAGANSSSANANLSASRIDHFFNF